MKARGTHRRRDRDGPTFSYETVGLLQSRAYGVALAYAGGSFLVALLAVAAGLWAGARLAQ